MIFTPACMDADELRLWRTANSAGERPALRPCFDCPAWFAVEMRAEGCCNGEPGPIARNSHTPASPSVTLGPRGKRYASDEERRLARRQSWRDYQARKRGCA